MSESAERLPATPERGTFARLRWIVPAVFLAVVAWLLAKNEIIAESEMMNRETLPRVRMPARSRFVPDNRRGGAEVK